VYLNTYVRVPGYEVRIFFCLYFIITRKVKHILVPVLFKFRVMTGLILHAGLSYIWQNMLSFCPSRVFVAQDEQCRMLRTVLWQYRLL
jgi:hypothetical protein